MTTCRAAYQNTRRIIAVITACFDESLVQVLRRVNSKHRPSTERMSNSGPAARGRQNKGRALCIVLPVTPTSRAQSFLAAWGTLPGSHSTPQPPVQAAIYTQLATKTSARQQAKRARVTVKLLMQSRVGHWPSPHLYTQTKHTQHQGKSCLLNSPDRATVKEFWGHDRFWSLNTLNTILNTKSTVNLLSIGVL